MTDNTETDPGVIELRSRLLSQATLNIELGLMSTNNVPNSQSSVSSASTSSPTGDAVGSGAGGIGPFIPPDDILIEQ